MKKQGEMNQNFTTLKLSDCRCFEVLPCGQRLTDIKLETPWWERELNFDQFNDLLNIWYSELPGECDLFANFMYEVAARDTQISMNADKVWMLMGLANEVCVLQRETECQLEFMVHTLPEINDKIEQLESKYSDKLYLDCTRLPIYEKFVSADLKTKQMEQEFADIYEQMKTIKNKIDFEHVTKIVSVLNAQMNTMNGVASKAKKIEMAVKQINELHEIFISMIRLSLQSLLANRTSQ